MFAGEELSIARKIWLMISSCHRRALDRDGAVDVLCNEIAITLPTTRPRKMLSGAHREKSTVAAIHRRAALVEDSGIHAQYPATDMRSGVFDGNDVPPGKSPAAFPERPLTSNGYFNPYTRQNCFKPLHRQAIQSRASLVVRGVAQQPHPSRPPMSALR